MKEQFLHKCEGFIKTVPLIPTEQALLLELLLLQKAGKLAFILSVAKPPNFSQTLALERQISRQACCEGGTPLSCTACHT